MSNKVRNVTKQLLGAEDVAFGRGIVQQNRGGTLVPVHKLDLDLPVADESELALTDTSKYPKASIGSRLFVAVNGQYQELSHIVPVIYRVGGALSAEYPYCENGNVIAKWTGEFPKTLTTADADFSPLGWQIYTVGSGRTIVSETQPPISYGAQGLRWYNPTLPATFVYYDDGTSGQWVEESSQSTDGGIREDLKLLNSTVQIAGVQAKDIARNYENFININRFGILGLGNDKEILQAAVTYCKDGKCLWLGDSEIELGTLSAGDIGVLIDSPVGMRIFGNGARIKATAIGGRSSMVGLKNPVDFQSSGVVFENNGFTIAGTVGGPRIGSYGFYVYATTPYSESNPCGGVVIECSAKNCMGLVTCDSTNQLGVSNAVAHAVRNLQVRGVVDSVYYGVSSVYGATNVKADLDCKDTRRGFISYGQKVAKVNLVATSSANFIGSDAFVEIACEGSMAGNVIDIDVNVSMSGVEAHEAIVNFYHQQDSSTGEIANVRSFVSANGLTTVGKNPALGTLNLYRFTHVNAAGSVLGSTGRVTRDCRIDCAVSGSITGSLVQVQSAPTVKSPLYLGGGITNGQTNFGLWQLFRCLGASSSQSFTPVVYGETVAGSASYSIQKGFMSVSDGVVTFSIVLAWSGHTGSGNMLVGSLPIKPKSIADLGNVTFNLLAENVGSANTVLSVAATGGDLVTLSIYSMNLTTRVLSLAALPASGYLAISGSYAI